MNYLTLHNIILVAIVLVVLFVRPIRRFVGVLIRIGFALGATALAIFAVGVLLNGETIYEKPGIEARAIHFVTTNSAATSDKGLGSAECHWPDQPPTPAAARTPAPAPSPVAGASPAATPPEEEDAYPELQTRAFPGISRQKLFEMSQETVNSFGGWKIVKADPRDFTIDCVYTARFTASEDDIRIIITPKSEIQVCARSGSARPNATGIGTLFPGDLGANDGHIKLLYETLEPKMDKVYEEEQEKAAKKKPKGGE